MPPDSPGHPGSTAAGGAVDSGAKTAKLRAQNLSAWFDDKQVLQQITLDIEPNQVTAVIGPSGCGKSTFIRCLNRMHELVVGARSSGSVYLDGDDIYDHTVDPVLLRRRVGMVFQSPNPFPMMTIRDNVLAGLQLTGRLRPSQADDIVERSLVRAALWDEVADQLDTRGAELSGGQQQRLCIARALAVEPDVILMDEPCSALDPIATARIEDLIHTLRDNYTVVIVTHNMQQATRVSDRTAFFLHGQLIEYGNTDELFTGPEQQETEDYITGKFG